MAIIQISKIQQRSGSLVDLPQLDEAQFGWANDAKRLFIGASNVAVINVENVEVLTSYSTISFSQVEGSGGSNVNITDMLPGQILAYDISNNSWINTGGNANDPGNTAEYTGVPIHLGTISNVKIGGGATGYILETDGQGNLNWTSKGTLYTNIVALSNATPIIMTVANTTPYTNGTKITISGVNGIANSNVNSLNFYVKLETDYPTSGNVSLFTDLNLTVDSVGTGLTYTNSPNAIATSTSGSGAANAGGSVNTIQYNDSGILNGSANFTITGGNIVSLTGSFSANTITGSLTTASQPNVTSVGTLSSLVVAGNITPSANITYNLGNNTNRFNDLYLANSTIYIGAQTISANSTSVSISGNLVANITGNVTGNVTTAGTVTTNAQPNITSVGILTSLSSSGNIDGLNITGTHYGNATGLTAIPGANVSGAVAYATTANSVAGANVSGAVSYATTANSVAGANISGAVSYATTANSVAGANVSGQVSYANIANSVAVANVTGIGNIATINKDGNSSNVLYGNGVFAAATGGGNGTYGDSNVVTLLNSYGSNTISTTGSVTAGNIITTVLTTGANTTAGIITGNFSLSSGSRLNSTYADLAEYYEADAKYQPGTVLAFGGNKEVTLAQDGTNKVAGVVSTDPAYVMNMKCLGEHIVARALQGRVPTKVRGTINKGDMLVSGGDGYARPSPSPQMGTVIGKALQNFDGIEGVIEVAVGRL